MFKYEWLTLTADSFALRCIGLGWVGSLSWWVGLGRVTENGPTGKSALSWQTKRRNERTDEWRCRWWIMVHGATGWGDHILGSGGQRSRPRDAKIRFGDLAEALFSNPSVERVFYSSVKCAAIWQHYRLPHALLFLRECINTAEK